MNSFKTVLAFFFALSSACAALADGVKGPPTIGQSAPDFAFAEVHDFKRSTASKADFEGKWLILDCWTRWCVSCVENFPKLNKLQQEFDGKLQVMLVGQDDPLSRPLYARFKAKDNLQLPIAWDPATKKSTPEKSPQLPPGSTLQSKFFSEYGIESVPHVLWIDPNGVLRAVTDCSQVTEDNLKAALDGQMPKLAMKTDMSYVAKAPRFTYSKPLLVDGNGGNDSSFLARSILAPWNGTDIQGPEFFVLTGPSRFAATAAPLAYLYRYAYGPRQTPYPFLGANSSYGEWWKDPILEVADKEPFEFDYRANHNVYDYEVTSPKAKATVDDVQSLMKRNLQEWFGYAVSVEKRMMPCWNLVATDAAKKSLLTKGGKPTIGGDGLSNSFMRNEPVKTLITLLWSRHQSEPPFIDATGIAGNIDVDMNVPMTDFEMVKSALHKQGLDLVKGEKEMNVIVIKDPKQL